MIGRDCDFVVVLAVDLPPHEAADELFLAEDLVERNACMLDFVVIQRHPDAAGFGEQVPE